MESLPMRSHNSPLAAAILAFALLAAGVADAQTQQGRMTGLQIAGDEPIQIESDRLEVRDNENLAVFSGNVTVVQGEMVMRSGTMKVHYAGNAGAGGPGSTDIERLEVSGGVHLRSEEQVATGEEGYFDMRTEVMVLTGDEVVLTEGDNVIIGCKLTVQMGSGRAELEGCPGESGTGRVRMLLQPGSQNR
jgi:lipopolysaccharide export system protein LptA